MTGMVLLKRLSRTLSKRGDPAVPASLLKHSSLPRSLKGQTIDERQEHSHRRGTNFSLRFAF